MSSHTKVAMGKFEALVVAGAPIVLTVRHGWPNPPGKGESPNFTTTLSPMQARGMAKALLELAETAESMFGGDEVFASHPGAAHAERLNDHYRAWLESQGRDR